MVDLIARCGTSGTEVRDPKYKLVRLQVLFRYILFYFVLLIIQSNYSIYVLSIYLEYYYSYLLTSALLKNFAGSERKDVKESVRIEMKRKSEVRTKEEQREIAIIWRRTKNFVRIYEDTGIEKNRYQAAARA